MDAGPAQSALRRSARLWSITLAALLLSTFLLPAGEMESVTAFRADVAERIHALRFGKEQLPEGHLDRAALLNGDSGEVLHIHGQEKTLYLRAYVGAVYEDGVWTLLPDSAYGADYSGMLEWLGSRTLTPSPSPRPTMPSVPGTISRRAAISPWT